MIHIVGAVAVVSGLLIGYNVAVIAGALRWLIGYYDLTPLTSGILTAAMPLGALCGALATGWAVSHFGRRAVLVLAAILFAIGAALAGLSEDVRVLTLARLTAGLAIGSAILVMPLYVSETAPAHRRGQLVLVNHVAITFGLVVAYVASYVLGSDWRGMFLAGLLPVPFLLAGLLILSDTPRWLALEGRLGEARRALARIKGLAPDAPAVTHEIDEIVGVAKRTDTTGHWRDLFGATARPALIVGMGLFLLQQVSGINVVLNYAPIVLKKPDMPMPRRRSWQQSALALCSF